jgi:polyisoprenoid-binding protein YceI
MKLSSKILTLVSLAVGLATAATAATETFTIDPVHSSVGFTIRHIVGKVPGRFTQFGGTVKVDRDNPSNNSVEATIEVGSVNTDNDKRNAHLKTGDFFDAAKFATITFKSTSWTKTGDSSFDVAGNLTIKDTTKPVVLKVTSLGFAPGMKGATLAGYEATTTLHRADFGVAGPAGMPAAMLGDDVDVMIAIEASASAAAK